MVEIKDKDGIVRFYFDQRIYNFLLKVREKISNPLKNTMQCGIIWGACGSGKSLLAQQIGMVIDPSLEGNLIRAKKGEELARVTFNDEDLMKSIIKSDKGKVHIGDEAISLLYKRNVMSKRGKDLKQFLDKIRTKNPCVLFCVPELTDLDKDILINEHYVNFVIKVYQKTEGDNIRKGNFILYPNCNKTKYARKITDFEFKKFFLKKSGGYAELQKLRKIPYMATQKGNLVGSSTKKVWYPAGTEEYIEAKEADIKQYLKEEKPDPNELKIKKRDQQQKEIRMKLARQLKDSGHFTSKQIAELLKVDIITVYSYLNETSIPENQTLTPENQTLTPENQTQTNPI
jgi:hypothetical protein